MKGGRNNRGFQDPDTPRWGIRKWFNARLRRYVYTIYWHAAAPKESEYLVAQGLTKDQAKTLRRVLEKGVLGQ